jgi:hypothetical protein
MGLMMARKIKIEYASVEVERKMVRIMRLVTLCSYLWIGAALTELVLLYFTTTIGEFATLGIQTVFLNHPLLIVFVVVIFAGLLAQGYFQSKANEIVNGNDVRIYEQ